MKFSLLSLGCKVNSYETNALRELFLLKGYSEDDQSPDIVVINTCSVTAVADQKSRQHIRKMRRLNPDAIIICMGCYSQKNADYILSSCGANIVLGTSNRNKIVDYVEEYQKTTKNVSYVETDTRHFSYESFGVFSLPISTRAYIKIEDGCNNFCSYCTIPSTRGVARSRNKDEILDEIRFLISKGYLEFVLTGIHTAHYGLDLKNYSFSDLLEDIVSIPELYRLRISSIEESEIDAKFISLLKEHKCIANHLHLPLQSGSPSVLKRMKRKYKTSDFLDKVEAIRRVRLDIAITTDVIVGFPGETEEEFQETCDFIKQVGFAELHVFPFSAREGTPAYSYPDQVEPKIKAERVEKLLSLSNALHENYAKQFLGREVEVLFEERSAKTGVSSGFTSNYLKVSRKIDEDVVGKVLKITYDNIE